MRNNYLKSGELSEESIQKTVIVWARSHPRLKSIVIHIPNEGKRSPIYGKKLRDMGMVAGVWDLLIATSRRGYIGAWIELKSKDGKLTPAQKEFGIEMGHQNYFLDVCHSIEAATKTISWYCLDDIQNGISSSSMCKSAKDFV